MGMLTKQRIAVVLDRMVREKEISAAFFARVAEGLEDPDRRGWFRRMGQDEKDQRKILVKHRRELCGPGNRNDDTQVSAVHEAIETRGSQGDVLDYLEALRLAVLTAEQTRDLCAKASDVTPDRSCRIFLKILSQESAAHRKELFDELRRAERARLDTVEEQAA